MRSTLTISLPKDLNQELSRMIKRKGTSRSQVIQEALRRQIAIDRFRDIRDRLAPRSSQTGLYTDEDVFEAIS